MRKSYKYRIYPNKKQSTMLNSQLETCRHIYNHFLNERKNAWKNEKRNIKLYDQINELPVLKALYVENKLIYSQVLQNIPIRIDLAFQAFFRRIKSGDKPGYPRFKGIGRYSSITYPQWGNGIKITDNRLVVSKIGHIKLVLHRELIGVPKTAVISKTSTGKWFVSISCEIDQPEPLAKSKLNVGIDVGIETFAYMSDNNKIDNPRFFRKEEKQLVKAQRKLSKQKKGSKERKKARKIVARVHERVKWKRENFCHQESRRIVNKYGIICMEDLNVNRMLHNHCLAKSISDASWNMFDSLIMYKAEWAGRLLVKVNPAYTSQDCSACGHRQKKILSVRVHKCECCGLTINRDLNASLNILRLGLQSLGIQSIKAHGL